MTEIRPGAMGQKLKGQPAPADAACKDSTIDMRPEESVLILIKHCRDMKQQETRLRLITLLLLLSCMALFLFTTWSGLRKHGNSGSSGRGSPAEPSQAYSTQERLCPADTPTTDSQTYHIRLNSMPTPNKSRDVYMEWKFRFGGKYDEQKRAIVIPKMGVYFVYARIDLSCQGRTNVSSFLVELHKRNEGYNKTITLLTARDEIMCTKDRSGLKTVFVGELFDLWKEDYVSVWIGKGYDLITSSSFGAYFVANTP